MFRPTRTQMVSFVAWITALFFLMASQGNIVHAQTGALNSGDTAALASHARQYTNLMLSNQSFTSSVTCPRGQLVYVTEFRPPDNFDLLIEKPFGMLSGYSSSEPSLVVYCYDQRGYQLFSRHKTKKIVPGSVVLGNASSMYVKKFTDLTTTEQCEFFRNQRPQYQSDRAIPSCGLYSKSDNTIAATVARGGGTEFFNGTVNGKSVRGYVFSGASYMGAIRVSNWQQLKSFVRYGDLTLKFSHRAVIVQEGYEDGDIRVGKDKTYAAYMAPYGLACVVSGSTDVYFSLNSTVECFRPTESVSVIERAMRN